MEVIFHSSSADPDAVITRCRELGVRQVCVSLNGIPGFGDTGVPNCSYLKEFLSRLADFGIRVPVAIAWFGNEPDLVLQPSAHQTEIQAKLRTLAVLADVGISVLLHYVDLAQSTDPEDDDRYWDGLLGVFQKMVHEAETCDVRLANHAIWRCLPDASRAAALREGVTMGDYRSYRTPPWRGPYIVNSHQDIIRLLAGVPSTHNGVCYCTGMHIMGGDVPTLIETFRDKIHYSQMRDVRGRWPRAEECFLGTGDLDFTDILRRLTDVGYQGAIGPEHLGVSNYPGEDLEALAVTFLQESLAELRDLA